MDIVLLLSLAFLWTPRRCFLDESNLDFNRQSVCQDESLPNYVLNIGVLDEPKAPGADTLLWPVKCQNFWLAHDGIALTLFEAAWMDQLHLHASLKGPFEVVIVLRLHHVDMKPKEAWSLK